MAAPRAAGPENSISIEPVKSTPSSSPPSSPVLTALRDPDHFLIESAGAARARLDQCLGNAVTYAREQPEKALGSALLAGYVLRILPLAGLVRLVIGIVAALLKPALVVYAGARLWKQFAPAQLTGDTPSPSTTSNSRRRDS